MAFLLAACGSKQEPLTPLETMQAYQKAILRKDTTTMKLLLSEASIKMAEEEAKARNLTLDDIVQRETLFSSAQTKVEFRNEKIDGDRASLEIKNISGNWETVPLVKENGVWKIDKQGYANQILQEIEERNRQSEEIFNQGRIIDDGTNQQTNDLPPPVNDASNSNADNSLK